MAFASSVIASKFCTNRDLFHHTHYTTCLPLLAVLNGGKVARELLTIILTVCREWLNHFPQLTAPVDKPELSIFGMKNTRRKMEDRYAVCLDVNSLYGLKVRGLPEYSPSDQGAVITVHCGGLILVHKRIYV